MAPLIIDNEEKLTAFLLHLKKRTNGECLIFVDIEGVNLGRAGSIAIMQLLIPPETIVYLVDIHLLGSKAFNFGIGSGTSLKSVLESTSTFKVFFDIRNDSDALYAHFDIQVAGIIDLQILEYATRRPRGKFVNGLAKCIERDLPYIPGWSATKASGRRLFRPEEGGRYEVFLERPIRDDIARYCEQDVMLMPRLLAHYGPKLQLDTASRLQAVVDDRISLSQSEAFNGKGSHMAIGPNLRRKVTKANTKTSPEINTVKSPSLRNLCRLDDDTVPDLVAEFAAMDLAHDLAVQDVGKASTTDRAASMSIPAESRPVQSSTLPRAELDSIGSTLVLTLACIDQRASEEEHDLVDDSALRYDFHQSPEYGGSDSDQHLDFAACSADDCGYCGKCMY